MGLTLLDGDSRENSFTITWGGAGRGIQKAPQKEEYYLEVLQAQFTSQIISDRRHKNILGEKRGFLVFSIRQARIAPGTRRIDSSGKIKDKGEM